MKVGLIIPTYNRPEYLERCFNSLLNTFLPEDLFIYIIDDCSKDKKTIDLIKNFKPNCKIKKEFKKKNSGINNSLFKCYEYLFDNEYDYVIVLDSDAIVNNYFYDMMTYFHIVFPNNIISGFNTLTINELGNIRHPIVENGGWYVKKNTNGALCIGITKQIYEKYTKPVLEELISINKTQHFDTTFTKKSSKDKVNVVCTVPSVAEHIGIGVSILGHYYNPDVSIDFKEYIEINTKQKCENISDKKLITVNIATYPLRKESLRQVIVNLLTIDIIDKIRVYLNEYTEVPKFLINDKIEYVIGKENLKDTGKFYWANNKNNEYYFTADDDLIFTKRFMEKHIELLNKYHGKIFVSLHGKTLNSNPVSFRDLKNSYHFNDKTLNNKFVNFLGTGIMVFDNSRYSIPIEIFRYHGMTDLWIAKYCQENNIPCMVRKHNAKKIKVCYQGGDTLWNKRNTMEEEHKEILDSIEWKVIKM